MNSMIVKNSLLIYIYNTRKNTEFLDKQNANFKGEILLQITVGEKPIKLSCSCDSLGALPITSLSAIANLFCSSAFFACSSDTLMRKRYVGIKINSDRNIETNIERGSENKTENIITTENDSMVIQKKLKREHILCLLRYLINMKLTFSLSCSTESCCSSSSCPSPIHILIQDVCSPIRLSVSSEMTNKLRLTSSSRRCSNLMLCQMKPSLNQH